VRTLEGHKDSVRAVVFDGPGKRLASASYDNTVKIWDLDTGKAITLIAPDTGWVHGVAFSPDGQQVFAVSNYTVRGWQVSNGALLPLKAPEHGWVVSSLAFRPQQPGTPLQVASASWDQTIQLWEAAAGRSLITLSRHTGRVRSIAFRPDGLQLASASNDGTLKIWDLAQRKEVRTLVGHTNAVVSIAFRGDGRVLASASQDQTVKVWDAATGVELLTLRGHLGRVHSVAFRPDGRQLAVASGDRGRGEVKLWTVPNP
jgi:WD40 repeat protein